MDNPVSSHTDNTRDMDIRNSIAELLSLHDCVIIPGFGGFIGNYSPARIDPVHHTFHPPSKRLLFNINLKQNDGLLANAVASSLGTSYLNACRMVDAFAEDCRSELKNGRPFVLPGIGQLLPGAEGIIYFEQDQQVNLNPASFGLAPFISPPVIRKQLTHFAVQNKPVAEFNRGGRKLAIPQILKWAAILALPVGIAALIAVSQYNRIPTDFTNKAGILSPAFIEFPTNLPVVITAPTEKIVDAAVMENTTPAASTGNAAISHDDRFAVIVGAFRIEENAKKFVASLTAKGFRASIYDQSKTGLYRVTIGTSSDREEVRQILASVNSADFSGAWILAK